MDERAQFGVGIDVLAFRDKKILLGKRKGGYGEGMWGLPGGNLEHGESMLAAAMRELAEETALQANNFLFSDVVNDRAVTKEDRHYLHVSFTADAQDGEVELREPDRCAGWEWFSLDELPDPLFPPHARHIQDFLQKKHFIET
jgi:8-oxo-dGTP diphosphatase